MLNEFFLITGGWCGWSEISQNGVRGQNVGKAQGINHLEVEEVQLIVEKVQVGVLKSSVRPDSQLLVVHV